MSASFASQHTSSFAPALRQLGVSLLVSTYQAGQLIILRAPPQNDTLNTHFCALERPMGMALEREKLAIGSAFQVWEYRNMPAVAAKIDPPDSHDACYLPRSVHVTGNIDIHEMAYGRGDQLWLVNTRMSCLCTLDKAYSVVPRWRPPFVSGYDLTDRCHLNGLAMRAGEPAFASALGETDSPSGWRDDKARGGLLLEVPSGRIIARGLSMPHSPRWYGGKLWYLESGAGRLSTLDPRTGEQDLIVELPGFTRGLDFLGQYAFVGLSQVRETAVFAGLPLTERVSERHCGVWVVDTGARRIVAYVVFTGDVREVFAVSVLPNRFPTLLDMNDALLRSSYALPGDALKQLAVPDPIHALLEQATRAHQRKRLGEAIDLYRKLLEQDPGHSTARYQLGVALNEAERWDEAVAELEKVIASQPHRAEAYNCLGHCYSQLMQAEQALRCFESAITADQQFAGAHFNRGLLLLKLGRYREAWPEYDWRWQTPGFAPLRCPQPRWGGEAIDEQTLLVHTEQGNGDALQFARFLPQAAKRCRKLILACTANLRSLLAETEGVAEVRLPGKLPADSFDTYCPIMGLAQLLDITLDNLPADVPYLRVPPHTQVPALTSAKPYKIGLVWMGSASQALNHRRSCPLAELVALSDVPDVAFYSLQTPLSQAEADILRRHGIVDLEPELTDYARTAALVEQLDLVISVCTSVAHLAGGLAKPVWILLAHNADWRWLLHRQNSPWYPTARLFRQTEPGQWAGVIARVRERLIADFHRARSRASANSSSTAGQKSRQQQT